jgi:saccharopine dehydrogenase (NAD+, L-lysine-forming)
MTTQQPIHIWLRDEVKEFERRTALSPDDVGRLIKENPGLRFTVERSQCRIFPEEEYERVGCNMVESNAWIKQAPSARDDPNTFILGLKELPLADITGPLSQRHIYFAHCYKYQGDWLDTMGRFVKGNGELLDLEFLNLDNGRRIAAFGMAAGFAGMAVGLIVWAHQKLGKPVNKLEPFSHKNDLVHYVNALLDQVGSRPAVLVLGALGRCGKGSLEMAHLAKVTNLLGWDIQETSSGGPFPQMIRDVDILVNDIYLSGKVTPFITNEALAQADQEGKRKLSVFVDVSCDVSNPHNPFPINNQTTTFDRPCRTIIQGNDNKPPLDVIAIDHLPSLTPRESSIDFSSQLVSYLPDLARVDFSVPPTAPDTATTDEKQRIWLRSRELFAKKSQEYLQVVA